MVASVNAQQLGVLRALRAKPGRSLDELADRLGLARTNFGHHLSLGLPEQVSGLVEEGLVEQHGGRYGVTQRGRRVLAEHALDAAR